jgi:hypothetical protein
LVGLVSVNRLSPHLPRATGAEVKHPCVLGKSGSDNQGFPPLSGTESSRYQAKNGERGSCNGRTDGLVAVVYA